MARIQIINGPNLNLVGKRETAIYGTTTLDDIHKMAQQKAAQHGHSLGWMQSNAEHDLIDVIHACRTDETAVIIINAAAYTHTSVAIRDALLAAEKPVIEIHLSNIHSREDFRSHSFISDIAKGIIAGFGPDSYGLAVDAAAAIITQSGIAGD